jgi:mono/diheme cytochrome c family protein
MKRHADLAILGHAVLVALLVGVNVLALQTPGAQAPVPATVAGNSDNGKRIFVKYGCAECHGREGQGSPLAGPRIGPNPLALAAFERYVRTPTGQMPPYTDKVVTERELADMRAFLQSRLRPPAAAQTVLSPD